MAEYEEIVAREMGFAAAQNLMVVLTQAPNIVFVTNWFRWNLIAADPDDNKFVDCAIACNAKFLVSEDRHFRVLRAIKFPKVEVLSVRAFREKMFL